MARVRAILKHVRVEVAKAKRKCHRGCGCWIAKGQKHLAVYDSGGQRRNYCGRCAAPILEKAATDLDGLRHGLSLA
jgi:polyferredoxin